MRSSKVLGVVFLVMVLSFCLSDFQLLSLTTRWYIPTIYKSCRIFVFRPEKKTWISEAYSKTN